MNPTQNHFGNILISFTTFDQIPFQRGKVWKIGLGIGVSIGIAIGIVQQSLSLGLLSAMIGIFYILSHNKKPQKKNVFISDAGIGIDKNFYSYNECKYFGIIWQPLELCMLQVELNTSQQKISILIPENKRQEIKEVLKRFLEEDENMQEDRIDKIIRLLKL